MKKQLSYRVRMILLVAAIVVGLPALCVLDFIVWRAQHPETHAVFYFLRSK
jgi:hypothetical protein